SLQLPKLVWDLVVAKPNPTVIVLESIDLRHAEVVLRDDGSGKPTLARTFQSRKPSEPETSKTFVDLQNVELGHAWIHGAFGSAPALDVELWRMAASARIADTTQATLERLRFEARGLPKAVDPRGEL